MALTDTQARQLYETYYKPVSNSTWNRTKKMFTDELPMVEDNIKFVAAKKRHNVQFGAKEVHRLKQFKIEFGNKTFTGKEIIKFLIEKIGVSPSSGTISIWFNSCGGYHKHKSYNYKELENVLMSAMLYAERKGLKQKMI